MVPTEFIKMKTSVKQMENTLWGIIGYYILENLHEPIGSEAWVYAEW